jgi:hypothetical protein
MWQRLAICPDVAELLAVVALRKPILSSTCLHPDCDVAEACSLPRLGRTAGSCGSAKPILSSTCLHHDCDVAEACSLPTRGRTAGSYGTA